MHDERKIALFKTEFDIMKNLRHPNIVQVFGFVQEGANGMSIVMEYLPNGSIENYITAANPGKPPREDLRHMWCIQMAQALGHLHNLEPNLIIHRDVKPGNFLLSASLDIKLADFGVSRVLKTDRKNPDPPEQEISRTSKSKVLEPLSIPPLKSKVLEPLGADGVASSESFEMIDEDAMELTGNVGTARYMAPEVRQLTKETAHLTGSKVRALYSAKADVFSLGMVYYFVLEGKPPQMPGPVASVAAHFELLNLGGRPTFTAKSPLKMRRVVETCWRGRPAERPTARELVIMLQGLKAETSGAASSPLARLLWGRKGSSASSVKPSPRAIEAAEETFNQVKARAGNRVSGMEVELDASFSTCSTGGYTASTFSPRA